MTDDINFLRFNSEICCMRIIYIFFTRNRYPTKGFFFYLFVFSFTSGQVG